MNQIKTAKNQIKTARNHNNTVHGARRAGAQGGSAGEEGGLRAGRVSKKGEHAANRDMDGVMEQQQQLVLLINRDLID